MNAHETLKQRRLLVRLAARPKLDLESPRDTVKTPCPLVNARKHTRCSLRGRGHFEQLLKGTQRFPKVALLVEHFFIERHRTLGFAKALERDPGQAAIEAQSLVATNGAALLLENFCKLRPAILAFEKSREASERNRIVAAQGKDIAIRVDGRGGVAKVRFERSGDLLRKLHTLVVARMTRTCATRIEKRAIVTNAAKRVRRGLEKRTVIARARKRLRVSLGGPSIVAKVMRGKLGHATPQRRGHRRVVALRRAAREKIRKLPMPAEAVKEAHEFACHGLIVPVGVERQAVAIDRALNVTKLLERERRCTRKEHSTNVGRRASPERVEGCEVLDTMRCTAR